MIGSDSEKQYTASPAPAPAASTPDLSTSAPSPQIEPNRAWSHPVGRSSVISALTSLISITLMWLPFH